MSETREKAVAYARFSSDNQRNESLDAQIRAIMEYCTKNNIDLIKIYSDAAQSGTTDKRDQFKEMILDSKEKLFQNVIVHKLDRFARNRYDSALYRRLLRNNGVRLISVTEPLDDSPESIILESVLEGMSEYYSKNLAREVNKGLKENALKGLHNGGIPPLGFDVINKKYVVNEVEARTVNLIFELYADGKGYMDIALKLNTLGMKTKIGSAFGKNSIADILLNEKYLGIYIFNKRLSKKSGNRVFKPDEEIIRIDNILPIIISKDLWDKASQRRQKRINSKHKESREYFFSGKMRCGECGGAYTGAGYVHSKKSYNYYYKCVQKKRSHTCANLDVNASSIEKIILEYIKTKYLSSDELEQIGPMIKKILTQQSSEAKNLRKPLETQIKTLEARRSKLMELFYDGKIEKYRLYQDLEKLDNQIEYASSELISLPLQAKTEPVDTLQVVRLLKNYIKRSAEEDPKINKILVDAFVKEVVVHKDHLDIVFFKIPSSLIPLHRDINGGSEGSRTPVQIASTFNLLQFSLRC
ncbi:MAG: hypothetical protein FD179_1178 [Erysipelotrichaceae bacterium]|nr:MAG: hypothetical protein FD179_1178 [Erysipelotrichaceae bacterium]